MVKETTQNQGKHLNKNGIQSKKGKAVNLENINQKINKRQISNSSKIKITNLIKENTDTNNTGTNLKQAQVKLSLEEEKIADQTRINSSNDPTNLHKRETPGSAFNTPNTRDQNLFSNNNQREKQDSVARTENHVSYQMNSDVRVQSLGPQNSAPLNYFSLLDSANGGQKNSEAVLKRAPKLMLQIIEGTAFPQGTQIKINPYGVQNIVSQRLKYQSKNEEEEKKEANELGKNTYKFDFTTFFGSYNLNDIEDNQILEVNKLNDVLLPKSEGFGKRHFMVQFSVEKNGYFLKDMGEGTGTFVKVETQMILKNGHIISFGDSHLVVGLVLEKKDKSEDNNLVLSPQLSSKKEPQKVLVTQLMIQFIDGPRAKETLSFRQEDVPILIGRSRKCKICFKEGNLSREQCRIDFIDDKWILKDGDGGKHSTNGTWLFAGEEEKIYDGMIFKAGQSLFKSQIIYE